MFIFKTIMPLLQHKNNDRDFRNLIVNKLCLLGLSGQIHSKRMFGQGFVPINIITLVQ